MIGVSFIRVLEGDVVAGRDAGRVESTPTPRHVRVSHMTLLRRLDSSATLRTT